MRKIIYLLLLVSTAISATAQKNQPPRKDTLDENEWRVIDSTDEDNIPIAGEGLLLDTTLTADELVTPEQDTGDEEADLENRIRDGMVKHQHWDEQTIGVWDEESQVRLLHRKADSAKLAELQKMKALQYAAPKPKTADKEHWAYGLISWLSRNSKAVQYTFYIALGLLLLMVLVLFIRKNDLPIFRRSYSRLKGTTGPLVEAGPANYEALAQIAIAAGNFRDAVRMRYLQALQLLENKQLIAPGKDKTNSDFLRELSRTAYHKPFATLTLHYEYVWYGQLPVSTGQFSALDEQFTAFKQSIQHA